MQLPNKLYSYKTSSLSLVPVVLTEIKDKPMPVSELYQRIRPSLEDATDFVDVMDCLYALRAADISDDGEVYVCL